MRPRAKRRSADVPRLLRIHFSQIGYKDARLAPLTIDLRDKAGGATDSVLWLRNGGGKSSIINLFFSIFRPHRNEFLGAAAEGKARRIEDYVKAKDLAVAVTEWDLGVDASGRAKRCIVGRALAWKSQARSADPSNLRRVFFTIGSPAPASDGARESGSLSFENLPILGLSGNGEPTATFEAFRDWLRELSSAHPAAEVVFTDNQRKWNEHLERLGLDPELFRYQIRMNLREGAADEAFRFGTALEFINFMLELAFDAGTADQVAKNLEGLRDQFARRPELEIERAFIVDALGALNPLVAAVAERSRARDERDTTLSELGGLARALQTRAGSLDETAAIATTAGDHAAETARRASNERDKRSRWARGLDHLAARLEVDERQSQLAHAEDLCTTAMREFRELGAARVCRDLNRLNAHLETLRDALRRAEEQLAPDRARLEHAGSTLRGALVAEHERLASLQEDLAGRTEVARLVCRKKQQHIDELRGEAARLGERIEGHRQAIKKRDVARDKLMDAGHLEPREDVAKARSRWSDSHARVSARRDELKQVRGDTLQQLQEVIDRRTAVSSNLARFETRLAAAHEELAEAHRWRQTLARHPCVVEVEALDEPDLESPGLEQRLRSEANAAAAAILEARVDGAEDERALSSIEATGLLPPIRDVERVVAALRTRSLNAHPGAAYLAETKAAGDRRTSILGAPARYAGVIVSAPSLPADLAQTTVQLDLRSPVQISTAAASVASGPEADCHVVPPHPASYDHGEAEAVRIELQAQLERQNRVLTELNARRRSYEHAADELHRYLEKLGRGQLDALEQSRDAAAEQAELARAELRSLAERQQHLQDRQAHLDQELEARADELRRVELASAALRQFWDEHERNIEEVRDELVSNEKRRREAERELSGPAATELTLAQERLTALIDETKVREHECATVRTEASQIAYLSTGGASPSVPVDQARDLYRQLLAEWEQRTSDNKIQWQIEQTTNRAKPLRDELGRLQVELDEERIEELGSEPDLEERVRTSDQQNEALRDRRAGARAGLEHAQEQFDELTRRREAHDLPPETADQPTPTSARSARSAAEEMRIAVGSHTDVARTAEALEKEHRAEATRAARAAEGYRSVAAQLTALADGAGLVLPDIDAIEIPDARDVVDGVLEQAKSKFRGARSRLDLAEGAVQRRCDEVRGVATATRYAEMRSQARERMNAETDELIVDCERLASQLAPRLPVIDERLTEMDKHRRILIGALQTIGGDAGRLLQRAQRSSTLPTSLGPWAGKPYLRLNFQFPESDEEQRARLEPLVDRLVQKAEIPNGLELVKLAVAELAGARGFEAKVLKPDAVLRPEPVSITAMNTFSRGQQLTAAILLYCTLVQLRARSRGRGTGPTDAGILVLDNPIGTCSSVALLELQRTIAREMRVQLIYATGVDDLEALETLPNKVRLRNTMRDRNTGDFHVTHEAHVEAVRVATIGG